MSQALVWGLGGCAAPLYSSLAAEGKAKGFTQAERGRAGMDSWIRQKGGTLETFLSRPKMA